jgi:nucleotide-binding universal stress UspA family protein
LPGWQREDLRAGLDSLMRAQIEASGMRSMLAHAEIAFAGSPDAGLAEQARVRDAGLILGRRAGRGPVGIVRLGRVVRRVLRRLPSVVGVAAPDLRQEDLRAGPVLLALDAAPESDGAVAFARSLAHAVGRELVLAHARGVEGQALSRALPGPDAERLALALRQHAESALADAIARRGLADLRCITVTGSTPDTLLAIAEDVHAAAIVCGSRRSSLTERVFGGSTSSSLAGVAPMPVFVVPPDLVDDA